MSTTTIEPTQLELTTFDQLVELSAPHIKHYIEDLFYHDKNWIAGNPGIKFLHFTRECGTDLIGLYPADHVAWPMAGEKVPYLFGFSNREHILEQQMIMARYLAGNPEVKLFIYGNGSNVVEIKRNQAIELAQAWHDLVNLNWSTQVNRR